MIRASDHKNIRRERAGRHRRQTIPHRHRLHLAAMATVLLTCLAASRAQADWPMWRADALRTGATEERLPATLSLHYALQLPPPRPAWPAEQGKVRFDTSYDPVVAGGRLFVPSMVHDNVTAYDIVDGRALWSFFVDAPVRFAPLAHGDRLLFVSDDGYLYCVTADKGELIWRFRGGPADRWVLGNDRLISMWPARGAPVTYGETVYFAAGIWPFMGIFVHAVDIGTGQAVWTNSGSGSNYIVQQHDSPAFAGVAPQGYLAVNQQYLLVSGGMTVPAAFDRVTGRFLYYRPGDRALGKDVGGYEVVIGKDWFANHGALCVLADGEPRVKAPASLLGPDGPIGIAGKHLVAHGWEIDRYVETSVDKKGNEKKTVKYRTAELWRARLPEQISALHARAGDQLLASDGGSRIALLDIPSTPDEDCHVAWEGQVEGTAWRMLVSDSRLFVVTEQGSIFCFGDTATPPSNSSNSPQQTEPQHDAPEDPPASAQAEDSRAEGSQSLLRKILAQTADPTGYAVLEQVTDLGLVRDLVKQTSLHVLVTQPDAVLRRQWREELRSWDLLGTRVAVLPGSIASLHLPPYLANLVVCTQWKYSAQESPEALQRVHSILRPYGGTAVLIATGPAREVLAAACSASPVTDCVRAQGDLTVITRPGPLPGAGTWTTQNGDAGNTLVSSEESVRTPLGLLWFGGPPNSEVLPRHGHGPTPQVIGGRLFIEGRDMLRAVDVYTGRQLWQRQFKDVGIFHDNTGHHPGAGAIGGNYVSTDDSIYLIWQRSCLRLDPATGETLGEFQLPRDGSDERPYWGYLAVWGEYLVAASTPMLLHALGPGEKAPEKDQVREVPLFSQFGEGSRRLVVMDRFSGQVLWTRDAQFNFRHNAIAVGDGKLFCLDRMTQQRLAHYRRRGEVPVGDFCLYALDLPSGQPVWQSTEHAFGTWLAYDSHSKLLLQAGSKNRDRADDDVGEGMSVHDAVSGGLLWRNNAVYGGPPLLYRDTIVTQGTAFDLRTGEPKLRRHPLTDEPLPWQFARNYGCNTAIGCTNLLTFRSAAAGYFDLANDGGTGNLGGFRSSCTANLIAADGVLSAPDYTRTCTCSYQNQCSLAMIHMRDVEMWTFNAIASSGKRVERLGINFGAPGDRRAEDGTLWLEFPSVGGPSPDVPLLISGDPSRAFTAEDSEPTQLPEDISLEYFREHMSVADACEPKWVFASGVRGARKLRIRLASREEAGGAEAEYLVRFFLRTSPRERAESGELQLKLQGKTVDTWTATQLSDIFAQGAVREYSSVAVSEFLDVEFSGIDRAASPHPSSCWPPDVCGIEILLAQPPNSQHP